MCRLLRRSSVRLAQYRLVQSHCRPNQEAAVEWRSDQTRRNIMARDSGSVGAGLQAPAPIGTIRVDLTHQGGKAFEAVLKNEDRSFDVQIDEPTSRGGQSQGVWPLGYFVTGAASC